MILKDNKVFVILGIGMIVGALGSMVYLGYAISQIESEFCQPTSCEIFTETCQTKGTEFPCYTAKGNYTFTYQGKDYFHTTVLSVETFYEVGYEACKEFTSSPRERCYFSTSNVEGTINIGSGIYFMSLMLATVNLLVLCTGIFLTCLMCATKVDTRQDLETNCSDKTSSSEFNLVQLDDDT